MTSKPLPRLATTRSRHQSGLRFAPGAGSLWARYAAHVSGWNGETDDGLRRQVPALRMGCQDIVELRRGDHSGARLHLERERDKTGEQVVAHFERWARHPEVRDWINREWTSPEERARRIREICGLPPEPPAEAAPATPRSNQVKAGQSESIPLNPLPRRSASSGSPGVPGQQSG